MRKLSEDEKNFTRNLVKLAGKSYNVFFSNIVDGELHNTNVELDYQNEKIDYLIDKDVYLKNPDDFIEYARNLSWKMIRYYQLLHYFQRMEMLFLYQETPTVGISRFGTLPRGKEAIASSVNDPDAVKLILEYSKKTIMINPSLIDYVGRDFRTEEDIRYKEQLELSNSNLATAKTSLNIALVTMGITIVLFIIDKFIAFCQK